MAPAHPLLRYDRAKLEASLILGEGERLKAYRDSRGIRTIGVGRNLEARRLTDAGAWCVGITPGETAKLGITVASCLSRGITRTQSRALLANDIYGAEKDLDRALPWWRSLGDVRQRILLEMCFNLGIGSKSPPKGLLSFAATLPMIAAGRYAEAAQALAHSKWDGQIGARADRLEKMLATGLDPATPRKAK